MADSPSESAANSSTTIQIDPHVVLTDPAPEIPIEIVSDEEMALIEAALAATRSLVSSSVRLSPPPSSSSSFQIRARSIQSITLLSKKRISGCKDLDIEDSGNLGGAQKKNRVSESYLQRFRRKRALGVTDFTATEWCEKQMEYVLVLGRRKVNRAMKVGQARHLELEEEVVKRVKVSIESDEDRWALKLISFITGVNQLLFEGLTRELPLIGFLGGAWITGVIDEIRMPQEESSDKSPLLVDTKTRLRDTLPAEPQRRNGRLQLMLYKLLWDTLVANEFPSRQFFTHFCLNPYAILSQDIRNNIADAGFSAQTLDDILGYYIATCKMLPLTHNQLLLRYEFQKDHSLLAEVRFDHDLDWVTSQLHQCLEFWKGDREASLVPDDERWKCRHCQFSSVCNGNSNSDNDTQAATQAATPSTSPSSSSSTS